MCGGRGREGARKTDGDRIWGGLVNLIGFVQNIDEYIEGNIPIWRADPLSMYVKNKLLTKRQMEKKLTSKQASVWGEEDLSKGEEGRGWGSKGEESKEIREGR